jgi:DNA-binding NtrC family response regulator
MARILVIEQDIILLSVISSALRQSGHTVIETTDPIQALRIAEEQAQALSLVLTDVETEPISGFELVKCLVIKGIDIPTQLVSGFSNVAWVIASTFGEHAVIQKPLTEAALQKGVARFLAKSTRRPNTDQELEVEAA